MNGIIAECLGMASYKDVVNGSHYSPSHASHSRVPILPTIPLGFMPPNLNFSSYFPMSSIIDMLAQGFSSSPSMCVNLSVG